MVGQAESEPSLCSHSAEEFTSASRSVKAALVCSGIVSAWTWSATLLQSSAVVYTSGLSGAWWYAVGGTIQIVMFSALAANTKLNADGAHTFLEIVRARFGGFTGFVFTVYALLAACIVCGSLLLGGSATVSALTGMDTIAACFLLPVGIVICVLVGGLRSTFVCDYTHTVILFIILFIFAFKVFSTSDQIGSPSKMYDLLQTAAKSVPVDGNAKGSYMTMRSVDGLIFAVQTASNGFAGVFCDQGYWQRAIASRPDQTTKAYFLGGISWFAVPFCFATTMGLAARALVGHPSFPTYPDPLTSAQVSAGLPAVAAAVAIAGKSGAVMVLLLVFMAVTSAASAELIATSSIMVFDIYKPYFRPNADAREVVRVMHYCIVAWGIWMGVWSMILHKAGIDLGWLFYAMGTLLGSAVAPIALTVGWSKLSKAGVWFGVCISRYGSTTIDNMAKQYSSMATALTSVCLGLILSVGVSLLKPDDYDFGTTRAIQQLSENSTLPADSEPGTPTAMTMNVPSLNKESSKEGERDEIEKAEVQLTELDSGNGKDEKRGSPTPMPTPKRGGDDESMADHLSPEVLKATFRKASWISPITTLIVAVLIPLPLFFSNWEFNKAFFTVWVISSILWLFAAGTFCIVLPITESSHELWFIIKAACRCSPLRTPGDNIDGAGVDIEMILRIRTPAMAALRPARLAARDEPLRALATRLAPCPKTSIRFSSSSADRAQPSYLDTEPRSEQGAPSAETSNPRSTLSTSDRIFLDAQEEEEAEREAARRARVSQDPEDVPWTGDERVQDTVLRMLMDKHKPLRIRSTGAVLDPAAEKLKSVQQPTAPGQPPLEFALGDDVPPPGTTTEHDRRLPATPDGQPWNAIYVRPSHSSSSGSDASIYYGKYLQSSEARGAKPNQTAAQRLRAAGVNVSQLPFDDPKAMRRLREGIKRFERIGKIEKAKEGVLDYQIASADRKYGAVGGEGGGGGSRRPTPGSARAWQSLVDERIEAARQAGVFKTNKLRGKPLRRDVDETNPYLKREEFFMNRIIKRQGAAPPWVELNSELESDLRSFRARLQENWVRRASRMITSSNQLSAGLEPFPLSAFAPPSPVALEGEEPSSLEGDVSARPVPQTVLPLPTSSGNAKLIDVAQRFRDREWEAREHGYHLTELDTLNTKVRRYNHLAPYTVRRPLLSLEVELEATFVRAVPDLVETLSRALLSRSTPSGLVPGLASAGTQPNDARAWRTDTGRGTLGTDTNPGTSANAAGSGWSARGYGSGDTRGGGGGMDEVGDEDGRSGSGSSAPGGGLGLGVLVRRTVEWARSRVGA